MFKNAFQNEWYIAFWPFGQDQVKNTLKDFKVTVQKGNLCGLAFHILNIF